MNKSVRIVAPLFVAMLLLSGNSCAEDKPQSPAINEEYEMDSWTSAKDIDTVEAYEVYLNDYANGRHAKFARAAINKIKKTENPKALEESNLAPVKAGGDTAAKLPEAVVAPAAPMPSAATPATPIPAATPVAATPPVVEAPPAKAAETKPEPVPATPATTSSSAGAQQP
ncbi:MAG: hypothetical protein PHQ60_02690 [Sideroxydans sp.]|nr:hypothetical protein [Sideroxydans sp.]